MRSQLELGGEDEGGWAIYLIPIWRQNSGCSRHRSSIHPNVHVGQQDFQERRDAGEYEARRDVRGGSRLFLFPDPLGLHNPATAPLAEKGERAAHG